MNYKVVMRRLVEEKTESMVTIDCKASNSYEANLKALKILEGSDSVWPWRILHLFEKLKCGEWKRIF